VVHRVGRREGHHFLDATPAHFEAVYNSGNWVAHRVRRIQAVRKRKGIEHTIVSDFQYSLSFLKIYLNARTSYRGGPKQSRTRDSEVIGVWARRAQTVDSNEDKVASMLLSVIPQVHSGHEATVSVETVLLLHASV
jgi:hypothetical protein